MISKVMGSTISGFMPSLVSVEIGIQKGLPKFEIVGLGQSAVKEGKERILTAIKSSGFLMDSQRIIVNLAPASVKKDGSSLDLPLALGILIGIEILQENVLQDIVAIGELSLDGSIQPVRGIFAMVEELKKSSVKKFILPWENTNECEIFQDVEILPAKNLQQVVDCLQGKMGWPELKSSTLVKKKSNEDWSDVKGQPLAKRAMEIAASGGHHLLLSGTPGVGKTLLAKRFHTILPELTSNEEIDIRKIKSLENVSDHIHHVRRPFRAPHHHASLAGIIGGGRQFRLGEFTLAHQGVLFMDEFPEFRKDVIEALREPLEEGVVRISRAEGAFICPAKFQLIAAMNLCPCGALGDDKKVCVCTPWAIQKYKSKLSGPIQDRVDLFIELKNTEWKILWADEKSENSSTVRSRVIEARNRQAQRYQNMDIHNSNVPSKELLRMVELDEKTQSLVDAFVNKEGLSLRSLEKVIRVARTIADMENVAKVGFEHVCEALQFRTKQNLSF